MTIAFCIPTNNEHEGLLLPSSELSVVSVLDLGHPNRCTVGHWPFMDFCCPLSWIKETIGSVSWGGQGKEGLVILQEQNGLMNAISMSSYLLNEHTSH